MPPPERCKPHGKILSRNNSPDPAAAACAACLAVNRRVCIGVNTTRGFNLREVIKNVFHILICRIEGVDPFAVVEIGTIDQLLFGN